MVMADIPQSIINSASGHSQKSLSNQLYHALHTLPNAPAVVAETTFGDYESDLNNTLHDGGGAPTGGK